MYTALQNGDVDVSQRDVYEYMLTREQIQGGVAEINATVKAEIAEAKCKFKAVSLPNNNNNNETTIVTLAVHAC